MKTILAALALSLITSIVSAQEISFDKKSGDFSGPGGSIAKLNSERVKAGKNSLGMGVGKNYFLTDATGANEYLGLMLQRFEDTLGSPTRWYYTMRCTPLALNGSHSNFGGFKEVGELVLEKKLLLPDGKMNEAAMKDFFAGNPTPDLPALYQHMNDSMVRLITVTAPHVQRNMRKPVIANEYGKIGQDNSVIGTWELVTTPPANGLGSPDYDYIIRNNNGGIICVAWVKLGGVDYFTFDNGKRGDGRIATGLNENPIQNKIPFVEQLSRKLVQAGLL